MPDLIHLLPDAIANQIAAGEVVQRPASVAKELLENSVDAGSTKIQFVVRDAGKTLMQVIDNGKGMSETDARMCFERHATSKIRSSEDLFKIQTMGFRGEALASIAAVARVELKTKTEETELGSYIHIEASEIKEQSPVAAPSGTSVAVKNLFFNVPARRNFLKSDAVENRHLLDEFHRVALANPAIAFDLVQNDKETYSLPAGKLSQRIVSLFGKNYQKQLVSCEEQTHWMKVYGYVGTPDCAKKNRGEQFFFVNGRFIKSNYLNHAVFGAYEGMMQQGQFPFYALFIKIDPSHIDINVHPTKTEIKFDEEKGVYGIVKSAVKQALGLHQVTPALDFGTDVNFINRPSAESLRMHTAPGRKDREYGSFKSLDPKGKGTRWDALYEQAMEESTPTPEEIRRETSAAPGSGVIFQSELNAQTDENLRKETTGKALLIHEKYILKQVKKGLLVIDLQAAHERILYERYQESLSGEVKRGVQRCLFPVSIDLSHTNFSLVMELRTEITALGFDFEPFDDHSIVVHGIPADMKNINEKEVFEALLEQFKHNESELSLDKQENMARSMAKRIAGKVKIAEDHVKPETFIDCLFACKQPNFTPYGTSTFVLLGLDKITELF